MIAPSELNALAIDGGGTRCRIAWIAENKKHVVITGASNASSDFAQAVSSINQGLGELGKKLGVSTDYLRTVPAYLGIAGVISDDLAQRLSVSLAFDHARIEDDRPCAVIGALGNHDGYVAHCGTGSFFSSLQHGEMRFTGGWGPILDDIAAASWVGRQALTHTLRVTDGCYSESALSTFIAARFGASAQIVEFAMNAAQADMGAIAPHVAGYANDGDQAALEIMTHGAQLIAQTLRAMGWQPKDKICLSGGFGQTYAAYLPQDMQASLFPAKGEPLDGAVELARKYCRELQTLR